MLTRWRLGSRRSSREPRMTHTRWGQVLLDISWVNKCESKHEISQILRPGNLIGELFGKYNLDLFFQGHHHSLKKNTCGVIANPRIYHHGNLQRRLDYLDHLAMWKSYFSTIEHEAVSSQASKMLNMVHLWLCCSEWPVDSYMWTNPLQWSRFKCAWSQYISMLLILHSNWYGMSTCMIIKMIINMIMAMLCKHIPSHNLFIKKHNHIDFPISFHIYNLLLWEQD